MIPIADPELGKDEQEGVVKVLDSGMLADGPEVRSFEDEFAAYCDVKYGVATSNGTTALHAALSALGIGEGDRVLTTPFSFVASANAIRFTGAEPVFADIDPETYNLDPHAVEEVIRRKEVDAIIAVHLYGLPAAMDHLCDIAETHDVAIIEDAAQAHGASFDGQPVGSIGDVACFSFYPTKNMTTGEGGMITTARSDIAERAAQFVNHGRNDDYEHEQLGHNFRMTSIAAAIGRAQLEKLPGYIEQRRSNATRLTQGLSGLYIKLPAEPPKRRHVYHQYTIQVDDRGRFIDYLEDLGVGTGVYYPTCIHNQPAYSDYNLDFPVAERAADEVVSLPVHPNVSDKDITKMVDTVQRYMEYQAGGQ